MIAGAMHPGLPVFLNKPHSDAAADWYSRVESERVAAWCTREFARALSIKQCTGAIDAQRARFAWPPWMMCWRVMRSG